MRNYLCKWPNGDVVLVGAADKQQVREILDEAADPGMCEIVRVKGPFALELLPKLPRKPADEGHDPGANFGRDDSKAPDNPRVRPRVMRWAGNRGETLYADVYQECGGQLTAAEAAAVARWRAATGGAAAQQAAAAAEPWVTERQLQESGMLDNPYHVQVELGHTEYGRFGSRLLKQITKAFFPRIHAALKPLAAEETSMGEQEIDHDEAVRALRAAVASDVADEQKAAAHERKRAKLLVDAQAGDRNALLQIMTDQTANVYGREDDDDDDELDDDDEDDDGDDSEGGMGFLSAIRHGRALELAAQLGVNAQASNPGPSTGATGPGFLYTTCRASL
ncbi:hypothetical protein OEZ86_008685 [Tetradesmus obliquus]|nr:hypothetical protein OEZ86_008685 [Tetradesmus obliquus]